MGRNVGDAWKALWRDLQRSGLRWTGFGEPTRSQTTGFSQRELDSYSSAANQVGITKPWREFRTGQRERHPMNDGGNGQACGALTHQARE